MYVKDFFLTDDIFKCKQLEFFSELNKPNQTRLLQSHKHAFGVKKTFVISHVSDKEQLSTPHCSLYSSASSSFELILFVWMFCVVK